MTMSISSGSGFFYQYQGEVQSLSAQLVSLKAELSTASQKPDGQALAQMIMIQIVEIESQIAQASGKEVTAALSPPQAANSDEPGRHPNNEQTVGQPTQDQGMHNGTQTRQGSRSPLTSAHGKSGNGVIRPGISSTLGHWIDDEV